ncbi:enoyl-CoA hydratase-related protein [Mycobacterium intracellulare]|uniref:Enoyl-CoA hydratase n=1 Tax=Mycobacterium intracellulare subsp. chimaera TaxID=222805 RepID=A0A7U5MQ06_MYCIT|nr:enoyl-CoA hydratase-related protein [Mycobacterium intracellulare]ASL17558.1 enoyl-CoA hydratase [Mycobacterium intracellulare subsp. chimaera]MDM3929493.1 enoyl-CoA hydratase-related protein [Mycobacterium intracellulare subsp. chimaera]
MTLSDQTASSYVKIERTERHMRVVLDSPHNRNALSAQLLTELDIALSDALSNPTLRTIELTATGTIFCSGADLKERSQENQGSDLFPTILKRIRSSDKPVICRLNGPARAGGIGLMAACHIVVAPRSATFAFTEVRLGVAPAVIAVPVLQRVVPHSACKLFLTGRTFDAAEAEAIGLVDNAVADDDVAGVVDGYVREITLGAPGAVGATLRLLLTVPTTVYDEALYEMNALSGTLFAADEAREGIAAWRERRSPAWADANRIDGTG